MNDAIRKDLQDEDDAGKPRPLNQGLVPISQEEARRNQQALVLMSEQMQQMNDRMESVRTMLEKLPGTIGAAVAQALSRPQNASGPPVPFGNLPPGGDVEFGKGQAMKIGGKVVTEGMALPEFRPPKSRAKDKKS